MSSRPVPSRRRRRGAATALTAATAFATTLPPGAAPLEAQLHPDLAEAVQWYTGETGTVDDARARALVERTAATGDVLARMWVARCLSRGRMGCPEDPVRARVVADSVLASVRALADAGEPEAVFLMGTAHDEALGVAEDAVEAARWYRRAAEAGHVLARHNLGNAYRAGRGVGQSDSLAVRWWRQAAEAGDAIAELRMGEMTEQGRGIEADLTAARAWYRRAAARGNARAAEALERLAGAGASRDLRTTPERIFQNPLRPAEARPPCAPPPPPSFSSR